MKTGGGFTPPAPPPLRYSSGRVSRRLIKFSVLGDISIPTGAPQWRGGAPGA